MLDTDRTHAIWQTELALAGMLDIDIALRMAAVKGGELERVPWMGRT